MQYYTRLAESPSLATLAMLQVNPSTKVEVIPMEDRYGRTVAVRTVPARRAIEADAVYVCAGDNALFVANVIALAHAHNVTIDAQYARRSSEGI